MRSSRFYIRHKAAALSDYEGQLRREPARIEKRQRTLEAFRFLSSKSKHEVPWRHEGTVSTVHLRVWTGQRRICPGVIWPRRSILASQRHSQVREIPAAERLEAEKTATCVKTHLSSEERCPGSEECISLSKATPAVYLWQHNTMSQDCVDVAKP